MEEGVARGRWLGLSRDTHLILELPALPLGFNMSETVADDRSALVNRQLPEMTLSTADNPLTAPQPPQDNLSTAQRAQYRFQVKGNAIST